MTTLHFDPMTGKHTRITVLDGDTTHPQQCHPTPYALFQHVPLSDIRSVWRSYRKVKSVLPRVARLMELENMLLCAQLAAVTAERDALRKQLQDMEGEL